MKGSLSSEQLIPPLFLESYHVQQPSFEFVILYLEVDTRFALKASHQL